jgi:site-specific DNA-methyltransferase (adenine-specific)
LRLLVVGGRAYGVRNMVDIKLYHGDCLEVMKQIPDNSIDLVLTDPPYGISFKSNRQDHQRIIENDSFGEWSDLLPKMLTEFKRILTDTGCCCCCCAGGGKTPVTAKFTIEAIKHFHLIQTLVWRKFVGLGWKYRPSYENIVVLSKSKDNYNFHDKTNNCSNVIEGINQHIPQKGEHPTQKPVVLMDRLLKIHSIEGMVVLDPFMGSGTTGIACLNTNRNFIGIEKDDKYFEIAKKRIESEQNGRLL